jgi:pantothenate kinase
VDLSGLQFPLSLTVTEQVIDISGMTPAQREFYRRLFGEILAVQQSVAKPRVIVGLAGPTGAGKSVLAVLFKELARQAALPFAVEVVTIDAYHYPNCFLLSHFSEGAPLKQVKGRFDTYDVAALANDLAAFRAGAAVDFPAYSRKLHDPVPGSVRVGAPATLLLLEGLWLLSDCGEWSKIPPLLDYCYFIESDKERTREAVIKRHMTGGRTREDAARHYEEVDGRNSDLVMPSRHHADQVIPPYYSSLLQQGKE